MNGQVNIVMEAFTITDITGDLKPVNWKAINRNWDHLRGVNFLHVNSRNKIDMLLGVDYSDFHFSLQEIRGKPGQPMSGPALGIQIKLQQVGTKINTPELILAQQMVSLGRLVTISRNFGM